MDKKFGDKENPLLISCRYRSQKFNARNDGNSINMVFVLTPSSLIKKTLSSLRLRCVPSFDYDVLEVVMESEGFEP